MENETNIAEAEKQFVMRKSEICRLDEIDESLVNDEKIRSAFGAFKTTLLEVSRVVQVFYTMALAAAMEADLNRRQMVNKLRMQASYLRAGKEIDDPAILEEAHKATMLEWESVDSVKELQEVVASRLVSLSRVLPEFVLDTNSAVLRQSYVALWSATENLLREHFRLSLNFDPTQAIAIFKHEKTKRYWNQRDFSLEMIEEAEFDLQSHMGNVLLAINPMISLRTIKAAYSVIAENDLNLSTVLKSSETHLLFTIRNLIAHRNGFVDQQFLDESNHPGDVGEKIRLDPNSFWRGYMAAKAIGIALFQLVLNNEKSIALAK